jgi:hypothetical protein
LGGKEPVRHLFCLRGYYYFRSRIPSDLEGIFRCKEIKKALKTKDLKTAVLSVKLLSTEFYRVIKVIRSGILNNEQIAQYVREFFQDTVQKSEAFKAKSTFIKDEGIKENLLSFCDFYIERLKGYFLTNAENIEGFVDTFLKEKKIYYDKDSDAYKNLRREFIKALIEYFGLEK